MKINFKHIIIDNFLSLGHIELNLNDRGFTLINGINNCPIDGAQSNGCGKSSIMEAISFSLTGELIRGTSKSISNIHTEEGARVELDFDIDGNQYKIIRYRDHKKMGNGLQFFVNGEEKSGKGVRDSNKILSEYLPELTSSLIGSVIILGQGLPQKFTNNTPSGRKEVLEKLSKSDFMIEDIKNRLNERKSILSSNLRKADDTLLGNQNQLLVYKKNLENLNDQFNNLEEAENLTLKIQALTLKVNELEEKVKQTMRQREEIRNLLSSLNIEKTNNYAQLSKNQLNIKEKYNEEKTQFQNQIVQINSEIRSLNNEINKLKNISDTCPTCGQKLPNVHKVDTTDKEQELIQLETKLISFQKSYDNIENQEKQELNILKTQYDFDSLNLLNNINIKQTELNNINGRFESENTEFTAQNNLLIDLRTQYSNLNNQKENLIKSIDSTKIEISKLEEKIVYNISDRDEAKSRLDIINKMITISTRDFRGFLLTNVIDFINKSAKSYSKDIFGTDKLDFVLEGNNINISYAGKDYNNLSGGEQRRVDIATNFAIRDMLCQFSGFRSNLLCLDEIYDSLDVISSEAVTSTIVKRLNDIESVFVITHRANLMIPADSTITIIKDEEGISSIKN